MENHPIPQDVTGFQFKLIGNMTIKQFAYLATGIILAWVFFQLPISGFIKLPLCAFLAILGTSLAYLPVSGRPMDQMIGNFIKALVRPTQFIYQKTGTKLYYPSRVPVTPTKPRVNPTLQRQSDYMQYLQDLKAPPKPKIEEHEDIVVPRMIPHQAPTQPTHHMPMPHVSLPHIEIKHSSQHKPQAQTQQQNVQKQPTPQPKPVVKQVDQPNPPAGGEEKKILGSIFKGQGKGVSLPDLPHAPNLITGMTKDSRGNALPHILVEVQDKEGNPVRAFKTNEFGRFASATPLSNGTYTIKFEDPKAQNKFETKSIMVTGGIINPIEATSVDTREELRRSLFSKN